MKKKRKRCAINGCKNLAPQKHPVCKRCRREKKPIANLKVSPKLMKTLIKEQRLEIEKDEEMFSKKSRTHKNAYNWYQ